MPKLKEVGGGPAVGVANDFSGFLRNMLYPPGGNNAGTSSIDAQGRVISGTNDNGKTPNSVMTGGGGGISGFYNDVLSQGAGRVGGAFSDMLNRDMESQRKSILQQFASIGGGQSSGAAQALAKFNAESASKNTLGIADLQFKAISPLLESLYGISGKGIAQRQVAQEYSPLENVVNTVSKVAEMLPGIGNFAKTINSMRDTGRPGTPSGGTRRQDYPADIPSGTFDNPTQLI